MHSRHSTTKCSQPGLGRRGLAAYIKSWEGEEARGKGEGYQLLLQCLDICLCRSLLNRMMYISNLELPPYLQKLATEPLFPSHLAKNSMKLSETRWLWSYGAHIWKGRAMLKFEDNSTSGSTVVMTACASENHDNQKLCD